MEDWEIELYAPERINGRTRPKGWTGVVTQSLGKLFVKRGTCRVLRILPHDEAKKLRADAKKAAASLAKARAEKASAKEKAKADVAKADAKK